MALGSKEFDYETRTQCFMPNRTY